MPAAGRSRLGEEEKLGLKALAIDMLPDPKGDFVSLYPPITGCSLPPGKGAGVVWVCVCVRARACSVYMGEHLNEAALTGTG